MSTPDAILSAEQGNQTHLGDKEMTDFISVTFRIHKDDAEKIKNTINEIRIARLGEEEHNKRMEHTTGRCVTAFGKTFYSIKSFCEFYSDGDIKKYRRIKNRILHLKWDLEKAVITEKLDHGEHRKKIINDQALQITHIVAKTP